MCSRLVARSQLGRRALRLLSTLPEEGVLYTESIEFPASSVGDGRGERVAVVLPGLLGQGKNLRSFVMRCFRQASAESGTAWRALLVDLRNHGKSGAAGFRRPHTMEAAAADVVRTVRAAGHTIDVLLGHSLGGKVALAAAGQLAAPAAPMPPPRQVWVLDSRPGQLESSRESIQGRDDVLQVLAAIGGTPLPVPSREWLYHSLEQRGFSKGLQTWLGSNLVLQRDSGQYAWAFALEGAREMYDSYRATAYWDLVRCPPRGTELHLVRAARSDRWDAPALAELEAAVQAAAVEGARRQCGAVRLHTVPDAGHWLHVDNPAGLAALMLPHLLRL